MATQKNDLTPRQQHFCRCVASGMAQAQAYREAYDCVDGSLSKTQQESASRLMSRPKVRARVEALIRQKERGLIAASLSDREHVLKTFRDMIDEGSTDQSRLRAAELLGKNHRCVH